MIGKIKTIILLFIIIFFNSCYACEDLTNDEFTLIKEEYKGNDLKIQGYFYNQSVNIEERLYLIFIYRNGLCFYTIIENKNELKKGELKILNFIGSSDYNRVKSYLWGLFKVEDSNLILERKYHGELKNVVEVTKAKILNDTTFVLLEEYQIDGSGYEKLNNTYHFKSMFPKPDSSYSPY